MVFEYATNYSSGSTLYFVSFNAAGQAILTDGLSAEDWGTGDRNASDYAATMAEIGDSGHYVANSNVVSGNMVVQRICLYLQAGDDPADSDKPLAQGERRVTEYMQWAVIVTDRS